MVKILTFLLYLFVFLASFYHSSDLDLGWHLKYGEYFVKNRQILRQNIFSSEMTGYLYPNTSWASDVVLYLIFSKLGFWGISALGATVVTLTFYFFAKAAGLSLFGQALLFPPLLYLLAPQNAASYRAQLLSFLFLGILFYLLTARVILGSEATPESIRKDSGQARMTIKLWLIPPLFLFWANSHGEYLTGLVLFGLYIGIKITMSFMGTKGQRDNERKVAVPLLPIFALSLAATLVNPFGINIYLESLRHFANPLQKYVVEWLPFPAFSALWWNLVIVGIISMASLLIVLKGARKYVPIIAITFLLLSLSFWSRRYAWSFFYFSLFLTAPLIAYLQPKNQNVRTWLISAILTISFLATVISKSPLDQFTKMSWENYCRFYVGCSPESAQYLVDHNLSNNLYTFYDWGGWLIWNYPEIKPSMDGRMALWRDNQGYSAFEKYYSLEQNWQDIDKSQYNVVLISPKKPLFYRLMELTKQDEWELKYQDQYASIFVRKTQKITSQSSKTP